MNPKNCSPMPLVIEVDGIYLYEDQINKAVAKLAVADKARREEARKREEEEKEAAKYKSGDVLLHKMNPNTPYMLVSVADFREFAADVLAGDPLGDELIPIYIRQYDGILGRSQFDTSNSNPQTTRIGRARGFEVK